MKKRSLFSLVLLLVGVLLVQDSRAEIIPAGICPRVPLPAWAKDVSIR